MFSTIACALVISLAALAIGQATLATCGAREWNWLAPAVGVSVLMCVAMLAVQLPGRSGALAIVMLAAVVVAFSYIARHPEHRPPLLGLLAGVPVLALALVPFLAAGYPGTLGVSFNNDMAAHLLWAESIRSEAVAAVTPVPPAYPLGPHALVAVIGSAPGLDVEVAFAGLTMAMPVVLGWTALAALRRPQWWSPWFVVPLVGMTYLIAGYYGQGSFKEVLISALVAAMGICLAFSIPLRRRARWIPMGLLVAGALSAYGHPALAWPAFFIAIWAVGATLRRLASTRSFRVAGARCRAEVAPLLVGFGVLLVVVAPQIPRFVRWFHVNVGTNLSGIPDDSLGNLAGRLPLVKALGVWNSPDYRIAGAVSIQDGIWVTLVGLLVLGATVWFVRRGEWMLPAAMLAALLIWILTDRTQSPYVAAKALVVLAPLAMIVALGPLAQRTASSGRRAWLLRVAVPLMTVALLAKGVTSSWQVLTYSRVGPTAHAREIQSLRPLLDGRRTLYLGNDDFTPWLFAGTPVESPVVGFPTLGLRPEKPWAYGRNYDVDSLDASTLNRFEWVVAPRDAAMSELPVELVRVHRTRSFDVFRRQMAIPPRRVLREGDAAATRLDCATSEGRRVVARGGLASVREPNVSTAAPELAPGAAATVRLALGRGVWDLVSPYGGPRPIEVNAPGLTAVLPANLSRPGPRWPIGRIVLRRPRTIEVVFRPTKGWLTPASAITYLGSVIAVPVDTSRLVSLAEACGRLVDWYRPDPA